MSVECLVLVRRGGMLWGVAHSAVRTVRWVAEPHGEYLLSVGRSGGQELAADEVVGVVDGLAIHPAGSVMSRFWSEPAGGLAVHGETPLVVVDPERPPSLLRPS